jgi:NAD-dependent SIR2 family protein deacetylase
MNFNVRKRRKIVTFLGAGASAPFGYPTTDSFLSELESHTANEERKYLNSIRSLYWVVEDVEHVVEILDSILELASLSKNSRLSDFLYRYPPLLNFAKRKTDEFRFAPSLEGEVRWNQLIGLTERLRDTVEEVTFQQYESKVAQYPRIEREYGRYFSMLREHMQDNRYEVFTTNYDNVIEDYCCRSGSSCMLSVLAHEANPKVKDVEKWFILTKLHGSLNWLIDKATREIEFANTQTRVRKDSTRWDRNEYVLFGTKARLGEARIYDKLFDRLKEFLFETEVCIAIGFSFRDKHINEIFNRFLLENKSLRLLIVSRSPSKAAENLIPERRRLKNLLKEKRIIRIRCSFGTMKAINAIKESLLSL